MTDALHRCENCGIADKDVRHQFCGNAWYHAAVPCDEETLARACLQAALRELASERALVDRCRPYVKAAKACMPTQNIRSGATALLADIDGRGVTTVEQQIKAAENCMNLNSADMNLRVK